MADKDNKTPDLEDLTREGDGRVLEILRSHGDDLSERRHTLLFFYRHKGDAGSDPSIFKAIIAEGAALGFTIATHRGDVLIIEGHKLVDPENLEALSTWAEDVANEAGVHFDGWECAMDNGEDDLN